MQFILNSDEQKKVAINISDLQIILNRLLRTASSIKGENNDMCKRSIETDIKLATNKLKNLDFLKKEVAN